MRLGVRRATVAEVIQREDWADRDEHNWLWSAECGRGMCGEVPFSLKECLCASSVAEVFVLVGCCFLPPLSHWHQSVIWEKLRETEAMRR